MITKGVIQTINRNGNKCSVRMPLFETAAGSGPVVIDALINIPPGVYNSFFVGDVVFVSFEENSLEKPIVIGKMYRNANFEKDTPGGAAVFNTLHVRDEAIVQAAITHFNFTSTEKRELTGRNKANHSQMFTPKKMAYYILDTENDLRRLIAELREDFTCFKRWVEWKFLPENVHVDDGDIGDPDYKQKYEIDADKDKRKKTGRCEICSKKNSCLARFEHKRPASSFPERSSTEFPAYPKYLSR